MVMENKQLTLEDFEVSPIDFSDKPMVAKANDLLNSTSAIKKHSMEFWEWRFDNSPFAPSHGWWAVEKQSKELAAVVTYWSWKFTYQSKEYQFYQAMNGAANEKFRGLGVFKELNIKAMEYYKDKQIPLFGIPNKNSYPTYKRLGWDTIQPLNTTFIIVSPIRSLINFIFGKRKKPADLLLRNAFEPFDAIPERTDVIRTNWNRENLTWRFGSHPKFTYFRYHEGKTDVIFRIREKGKLHEGQIIYSCLPDFKSYLKFRKFMRKNNLDLLSYYGVNTNMNIYLKKILLKIKKKESLYFVVKNIPELDNIPFVIELAERDIA
jgi:hypothetical protein